MASHAIFECTIDMKYLDEDYIRTRIIEPIKLEYLEF
jgi:hypothetical protein